MDIKLLAVARHPRKGLLFLCVAIDFDITLNNATCIPQGDYRFCCMSKLMALSPIAPKSLTIRISHAK